MPDLPLATPVTKNGWLRGPDERPRRQRYVVAAIVGSVAIWAVAIAVMAFWPRAYVVESSLIVPNSESDARVDLKDVGQAYATSRSNYDSKSLDPRVNYKEIMLSANVIDAAAEEIGVPAASFGEPRIKLIDQSSVMDIRVTAGKPELSYDKARALHRAFQARLSELRLDELTQREQAIEQAVRNSRAKLTSAQQDLLDFKVGAQVVSSKQLEEMALAATGLQRRHMELSQKRMHDQATVTSLAGQLGVAPQTAGWTLTLQGDAPFLEYLRQFSNTSAQLSEYEHKWDESHPKMREAFGQRDSAMASMVARAKAILGGAVGAPELRRMAMVLQDRSREQLLRDLVAAKASGDATTAEIAEIERQRKQLAAQLPELAHQSAQLDELQRRVNFSEAVFTGGIGKTDVGHTNIFSSYPMVQTLVAPARPTKASSPRFSYIAAGAVGASLMLMISLSLAWLRAKR